MAVVINPTIPSKETITIIVAKPSITGLVAA
jgi:hypothetical protein